ncbi:MAG: hypothetical protein AABX48_01605 [Nanoarchaeota archaeon]
MVDRFMQESNLTNLVANGAFQFTDTFFPYTSGEIGPYYVQSVDITKNGKSYREAIQSLLKITTAEIGFANSHFSVISGGESRDWDFSNPLAYDLGFAHAKIYKDGKIIGADVKGKKVLHVADLNNEGSSVRDKWVPAIRRAGGEISDILC